MTTVPLRIHVLFQPADNSVAQHLADHLYDTFSAKPTGRAARIPVRYATIAGGEAGTPALDEADRTIVVVLVDEHMTLSSGPEAVCAAWEQQVLAVRDACAEGARHVFLPVAVDTLAFDLSEDLSETSFVRLEHRQGADRDQHLVLHVVTRAFRALAGEGSVDADGDVVPRVPVKVFVSHAKQDLGDGYAEGPVKSVLALIAQAPVEAWYDAAKIDAGTSFRKAIQEGIESSAVLVAVVTDAWSDREWCRRELLLAKELRAPVVVVDAFDHGCTRLFPYIGNTPTVSWRATALEPPGERDPGPVHLWWNSRKDRLQGEDAKRVIVVALTEALRHRVDRLRLEKYADRAEGEVVLSGPPEALTLAGIKGARRAWYPDPPLGREELDAVRGDHDRDFFVTPLASLARWPRPRVLDAVALSLSGSPDASWFGGSPRHLATLSEDLVLYMLLAGLKVCYGGTIGHGALNPSGVAPGDDVDYVTKLISHARSHAPLAAEIEAERYHPIMNVVAWPIWLGFTKKEHSVYRKAAKLFTLGAPPGLSDPGQGQYFKAASLEARYAWCRSLTHMRTLQILGDPTTRLPPTSARVALGGKLQGSLSRYPGVLEEILLSLRARQPLYLIGTFGGAARLVIDILTGVSRPELTTAWFEQHHLADSGEVSWPKLIARYRQDGQPIETPEQLGEEFEAYRKRGIAAALGNGLTDDENRELFACDDPQRAITLVLQGLRARFK